MCTKASMRDDFGSKKKKGKMFITQGFYFIVSSFVVRRQILMLNFADIPMKMPKGFCDITILWIIQLGIDGRKRKNANVYGDAEHLLRAFMKTPHLHDLQIIACAFDIRFSSSQHCSRNHNEIWEWERETNHKWPPVNPLKTVDNLLNDAIDDRSRVRPNTALASQTKMTILPTYISSAWSIDDHKMMPNGSESLLKLR